MSWLSDRRQWAYGRLWAHSEFGKLWAGQSISQFGSQLGVLYLLAILTLEATPTQMSVLQASGAASTLILGLFVGAWVDRSPRRPILIGADLSRALLLGLVALGALAGWLGMSHLWAASFLMGGLTILFQVAQESFVPGLVTRQRLVDANSRLNASSSVAEIIAPGLGGALVESITAPWALLTSTASFLMSAILIGRIRAPEPGLSPSACRQGLWRDAMEGIRLLLGNALLRPLVVSYGLRTFFGGIFGTLYGLYVIRELGLGPVLMGVTIGGGGAGALLGAVSAQRVARRVGVGPAVVGGLFLSGLLAALIPLAGGPRLVALSLLLASQVLGDMALAVYLIGELSLRQVVTPDHALGRVNGSFQFLMNGAGLVGLLVGGALGEVVGLRGALAVAAGGALLASVWLVPSPILRVRDLSELGEQYGLHP